MPVSKRVFLWTAPRCVSTAFILSVRTIPTIQAFHEPFCEPYYTANPITWQEDLLLKEAAKIHYSYEETLARLLDDYPGKEAIFVKEMAYVMRGKFDMLLDDNLKSFSHSFLIRNPVRAVYSFYKTVPVSFKHWYHHGDIGFKEVYDLYCFLKNNLGISPPIIDADDLLEKPEAMMEAYCNAVGLKYKEGMTKWEPNSMKIYESKTQCYFTTAWHDAALKSSGFNKPKPMPVLPDGLPEEVHKSIEESLVPYNKLYALRLQV